MYSKAMRRGTCVGLGTDKWGCGGGVSNHKEMRKEISTSFRDAKLKWNRNAGIEKEMQTQKFLNHQEMRWKAPYPNS